ncbi:MAG: winged helix-turn-helix transcriptional regulator [Candidatus Heimdallarchaeota archaeon]|nr:winged helix-turn-helix transcriptional regulator [Candidatus Heimdallarchaeota archaeon]
MKDKKDLANFLNALANERRLLILEKIEQEVSNPGELSRSLNLGRSTIEKHLRVMVSGNVLEKNAGLSSEGQLRIYYKMTEKTKSILELLKGF